MTAIPEPYYPFHDRTVLVTSCGRLCLYRKINLSTSLAGQAVASKKSTKESGWSAYGVGRGFVTQLLHLPIGHRGWGLQFVRPTLGATGPILGGN